MPLLAGAAFVLILGVTAIVALCSGTVALPQGETCAQCVREWIGALSGWATVAIAIYIGFAQLAPLVSQTKTLAEQSVAEHNLRLSDIQFRCRNIKDELLDVAQVPSDPRSWLNEQNAHDSAQPSEDQALEQRKRFQQMCEGIAHQAGEHVKNWILVQTPIPHLAALEPMRQDLVKHLGSLELAILNVARSVPNFESWHEGEFDTAAEKIDFQKQIRQKKTQDCCRRLRREIAQVRKLASQLETEAGKLRAPGTLG